MGKAIPSPSPPPAKSSWGESGNVERATGTEPKREEGERSGFQFHEDCTNRGRAECETPHLIPGGALVGRANPESRVKTGGVEEGCLEPHGERRFPCCEDTR